MQETKVRCDIYVFHIALLIAHALSCFEDSLKPGVVQALFLGKPIVILGDLNCNMLKTCPEQKALTGLSKELNLVQIINTPTRITDTCQTLIDAILVSSPELVGDSGVINTTISDHLPVYAVLKLKIPKPPPCYIILCGASSTMSQRCLLPTLLLTRIVFYPYLLRRGRRC